MTEETEKENSMTEEMTVEEFLSMAAKMMLKMTPGVWGRNLGSNTIVAINEDGEMKELGRLISNYDAQGVCWIRNNFLAALMTIEQLLQLMEMSKLRCDEIENQLKFRTQLDNMLQGYA